MLNSSNLLIFVAQCAAAQVDLEAGCDECQWRRRKGEGREESNTIFVAYVVLLCHADCSDLCAGRLGGASGDVLGERGVVGVSLLFGVCVGAVCVVVLLVEE